MSNEMNRRKFLKLTGTVVLATSVAGALGGCSGGGSSTPAPPSPEEEGIAQLSWIRSMLHAKKLDWTALFKKWIR